MLISLSRHATSASPEVRYSALSSLSRALLGPLVAVPPADVAEVFQRVLYPLLEALIAAPSDAEMTESRLRASTLLCKAFMRFEMNDNVTGQDVTERWVHVLDYLDRLMRTDRSDQLVRHRFLSSVYRNVRFMMDNWCYSVGSCTRVAQECNPRHAIGGYACTSHGGRSW